MAETRHRLSRGLAGHVVSSLNREIGRRFLCETDDRGCQISDSYRNRLARPNRAQYPDYVVYQQEAGITGGRRWPRPASAGEPHIQPRPLSITQGWAKPKTCFNSVSLPHFRGAFFCFANNILSGPCLRDLMTESVQDVASDRLRLSNPDPGTNECPGSGFQMSVHDQHRPMRQHAQDTAL
jgi:hypothetical protein